MVLLSLNYSAKAGERSPFNYQYYLYPSFILGRPIRTVDFFNHFTSDPII
ncbi:hypothetical protein M2408_004734 [Sphingobacterium sp. BIGb0165]|nr:hypothetical protein [Sphingobacterium sp. BIGb0165]